MYSVAPYIFLIYFSISGSFLIASAFSSGVKNRNPPSVGLFPYIISGTSQIGFLLLSTNISGALTRYALILSTIWKRSEEYNTRSFVLSFVLNPTITQWTWAFWLASLSHIKVRCAKSMWIWKRSYRGFQTAATCSPCVIEFVDTKAVWMTVFCISWAALKYHPAT